MNQALSITIRQAQTADYQAVFALIKQAFATEAFSDHQEQLLVERLRQSPCFIPELSLVAEADHTIVGYILLTPITIDNGEQTFASLALAPMCVLPAYQGMGIGGRLIRWAHQQAKALHYASVILLGHADYYPQFGYRQAHHYEIQLPFDAPKANCMAIELTANSLHNVRGTVVYPAEFFQ